MHRLRLVGPTALVIGALLLLGIGAGSAVGINYAMKATTTTTTTGPTPTAPPGSAPLSPSASTTPSTTPSTVGAPGVTPTTATAPTAPAATPSPSTEVGHPGALVTQAVTADVLATTWAGYAHAMISDDRASLGGYTTPSALNDSIATLDCGCLAGPMTYSTSAVSAPYQSSYPLSFVAGLNGTGYNQLSLTWWVVFSKSSPGQPWLVAFIAAYAEGGGLEGFSPYSTSAPMTVHYPLQDAPQQYVDYFQNLDMTGNAGRGAPPGWATDNILSSEVTISNDIRAHRLAGGLHETFSHSVDGVSPIFAQVINGSVYGSMECFSMTVTDDITSANGSPIVQPADQGAWGNLIPPGSYSSLKFTQEDDACVGEDTTSGVSLDASSGGNYAIATTPSG